MTQTLGILIAIGLVVGFIYVLFRPHWAVVLVIVMFPLEQLVQSYVPGLLFRPWAFNVAVGTVAGIALLSRIGRKAPVFWGMSNPVFWMVVGLYALAVLGLIYTPSPERAQEMIGLGLPYYVLMLVIMPLLIIDLSELNRVMIGMLLAGTIVAALIIVNPSSTVYAGRLMMDLGPGVTGTNRGNPLALASLGGMMALVAALIRFRQAGWLLNGLRLAAFVLGLGLAIRSGSRGQVLAAALAAMIFYPVARQLRNPKQFLLVAMGFLMLAVAIYVTFKLFIGLENVQRWDQGRMLADAGGRWERAGILLGGWISSPSHWVFGLGPNAFTALYPQESYVHNLFAEVLGEEGLVGATLLVTMLYMLFRGGRSMFRMYAADPIMRATVAVLLGICFFEVLISLKQGSFLLSSAPFPWLLVLAKLIVVEHSIMATSIEEAAVLEEEAFETGQLEMAYSQ